MHEYVYMYLRVRAGEEVAVETAVVLVVVVAAVKIRTPDNAISAVTDYGYDYSVIHRADAGEIRQFVN